MATNLNHQWMPFTDNREFQRAPQLFVRAEGVRYWNAEGRELLDGSSGLFCSAAGHGRTEIAEAVCKQLLTLDFTPHFQRASPLSFELAERLSELLPEGLNKLFFTNSGSESVDSAMKIALAYHRARGEAQRTRFVSREWAYHGVNFGGVAQSLISPELRNRFVAANDADYADIRTRHRNRGDAKRLVPLDKARGQKFGGGWDAYAPPAPNRPGVHAFEDWPLEDLLPVIDWTPFFQAWELAGKFPAILTDEVVGTQASELYRDAQAMLEKIVAEKWLTARAVYGIWPAHSHGDDVVLRHDGGEATLHFLRQQVDKPVERPDFCLADFIAPQGSGVQDWIGAFAVTAGIGIEPHVARFEAAHDDYNAILLKALADRLAEALAERLHQRVRTEYWGYAEGEALDNDALIAERYRGIRPAPGYPACPDHSEKGTLFALLDAGRHAGMSLTESFAMLPTAAVSGYYFSHPASQYFVVGRLGKDQVADYAKRKGVDLAQAERWLASNLDYDPE